jgi:uncharacterized protein (DUF1015 family)
MRMVADGVLIRDSAPGYYVYRLTREGRAQTGLAAVASLADYATNRIRKHELTTPTKEDDRVRQIEAIDAQTGPVMMAYPDAPGIDALIARSATGPAVVDITADDGVRHELWVVDDAATIDALTRAFEALPAIYIGDGHHRSAAAARVAAARPDMASAAYFLSVIFPHREMTILDYNLHPLLTWLLAGLVFQLPPLWTHTLVILAALPTGVNTYLFAQRYGIGVVTSTTTIFISTALSMLSLSLILFLLQVR